MVCPWQKLCLLSIIKLSLVSGVKPDLMTSPSEQWNSARTAMERIPRCEWRDRKSRKVTFFFLTNYVVKLKSRNFLTTRRFSFVKLDFEGWHFSIFLLFSWANQICYLKNFTFKLFLILLARIAYLFIRHQQQHHACDGLAFRPGGVEFMLHKKE